MRERVAVVRAERARILSLVVLAWGCGGYGMKGRHVVPVSPMPDSVVLTYLGSGGWLVESGGDALLTGPFVSNPGALTVLTGRIRVDTSMIDARLGPLAPRMRDAGAILIGHGHYDHLMDVPYVATTYATSATVYGSATVYNHIVGWGLPASRIEIVDTLVGDAASPGTWTTDATGRFRFQPVRSVHSPHFAGIHLWQGERDTPHASFPDQASDWVEGPTYAWLIDVLDGAGSPFFRIYYQDSGADPPMGHPAPSTRRGTGVPMVAVLTAPGHRWHPQYPDGILQQLDPEFVLTSHWEDFLTRDADDAPKPIPLTFFDEWVENLYAWRAGDWWVPAPLSRWVFEPR